MKKRLCILASLVVLSVVSAYASGRWNLSIVPTFLIPSALTIVGSFFVLVPHPRDSSLWNRWPTRLSLLALVWLLLLLPSLRGDGYFEMGRRAHIRSLFTPELIAEVRETALKQSAQKDYFDSVVLSQSDLPAAVGNSAWLFPDRATCFFDPQGRLASVCLTWGGGLLSRHGLILSDEQIPFQGFGEHFTDDQGRDIEVYTTHYFPLYPGSYILMDAH